MKLKNVAKQSIFTIVILFSIVSFSYLNLNFKKPSFMIKKDRSLKIQTLPPPDQRIKESDRIQIALLLDTSNSMDGLIDQAKSQLWNIINELAKAGKDTTGSKIEIALYEYGNDGLSITKDYIRQVLSFTTDLDKLSEKLFALKTNGGSEYCGSVIKSSITELDWSESDSAYKAIYIAGNEPFTQGNVSYKTQCQIAKSKHIYINTIFCGDYNEGISTFWYDGANCSGGEYLNINQNDKTTYVATPYDDRINQLNVQLNSTYVYYGSAGFENKQKQEEQDKNADQISKSNTTNRVISKSSKVYKNETWDLVDAYTSDTTIIQKVQLNTLPSEYRNKSREEIKVMVKTKVDERNKVKQEIKVQAELRAKYITTSSQNDTTKLTLENTMLKTVNKQAKSKGFKFEKVK